MTSPRVLRIGEAQDVSEEDEFFSTLFGLEKENMPVNVAGIFQAFLTTCLADLETYSTAITETRIIEITTPQTSGGSVEIAISLRIPKQELEKILSEKINMATG